jgi:hypothetical protein
MPAGLVIDDDLFAEGTLHQSIVAYATRARSPQESYLPAS